MKALALLSSLLAHAPATGPSRRGAARQARAQHGHGAGGGVGLAQPRRSAPPSSPARPGCPSRSGCCA